MREIRVLGAELLRLPEGAAVVPENRRAKRPFVLVEQNRAVHLPRQADPADIRERGRIRCAQLLDGSLHRLPPGLGVLLRPEIVRAGDF